MLKNLSTGVTVTIKKVMLLTVELVNCLTGLVRGER